MSIIGAIRKWLHPYGASSKDKPHVADPAKKERWGRMWKRVRTRDTSDSGYRRPTPKMDPDFVARKAIRPMTREQLDDAHRVVLALFESEAGSGRGVMMSRRATAVARDLVAWGFLRVEKRGNSRGRRTVFARREGGAA